MLLQSNSDRHLRTLVGTAPELAARTRVAVINYCMGFVARAVSGGYPGCLGQTSVESLLVHVPGVLVASHSVIMCR